MRIVVFGAAGFLGEHLVRQLDHRDHEVFAAMRSGSGATLAPEGVTVLEGDLMDIDFVRGALEGKDAAIFAGGRTWQPGLDIGEYRRQNVGITRNFFAAVEPYRDLRIVFTSSLATVAGSKTPFVFSEDSGREQVWENRLTPYDLAKIDSERIALDYAKRGYHVVVLNPGLILGPGASSRSKVCNPFFLLWICQNRCPFFIDAKVALCDVRDVARAHVTALTRGRSGQRYLLTGHNVLRSEFYRLLTRLTGIRSPRQMPCGVAYTFSALGDGLTALIGRLWKNPAHRHFVRAQGIHYCGDPQKAIDELDYGTTPLEETVLDALGHYLRRGLLPESLNFLECVTSRNARAVLCLRQLASRHAYSRFLLPRIPEIHAICEQNGDLRDALARLLDSGTFNDHTGRHRLNNGVCRETIKTFKRFFEFLYFASDEFLAGVS